MHAGRYKWLLFVLALAVIAGTFAVQRFRQNDTKTLTGFVASYGNFDTAIAEFAGDASAQERKASDALAELDRKASAFRLSSLVEHDADLMQHAPGIANISRRELEALKGYKRATQTNSADADRLAREYRDLASSRKSAYAHFQELTGIKQ